MKNNYLYASLICLVIIIVILGAATYGGSIKDYFDCLKEKNECKYEQQRLIDRVQELEEVVDKLEESLLNEDY